MNEVQFVVFFIGIDVLFVSFPIDKGRPMAYLHFAYQLQK